jgi:glutathione S-transferase
MHWIQLGLEGLEKQASATSARFMVGDQFGWAECCLVPQLFAARRFGVDPAQFECLSRIETNCLALDAVKKAHPDAQPDAQPA